MKVKNMIIEQIINEIKFIFPENAEFRDVKGIPENLVIDWKLGNDANRPNKRSIPIYLALSEEYVDDYNDGNDRIKARMIISAANFIQEQSINFNPEHNSPHGQPLIPVKWIVPTFH
jgi:hypothetical protein